MLKIEFNKTLATALQAAIRTAEGDGTPADGHSGKQISMVNVCQTTREKNATLYFLSCC